MVIPDMDSMILKDHLLRRIKKRVNFDFIYEKAALYYPSFYRNGKKTGRDDYLRIMRLRRIWAEGALAALKREHKSNT